MPFLYIKIQNISSVLIKAKHEIRIKKFHPNWPNEISWDTNIFSFNPLTLYRIDRGNALETILNQRELIARHNYSNFSAAIYYTNKRLSDWNFKNCS